MRVHLKQVGPGETDPELIWGVLFGTLCILILVAWIHLPAVVPKCLLRSSFGWPCPACGGYRALQSVWSGLFLAAWQTQPLAVGALCAGVLGTLYSWVVVLSRSPRIRVTLTHRRESRFAVTMLVAAVLVNWIYLCITL